MTENERIRQLRKTLGMTCESFGSRLGVGKTAISNIETGNRGVTPQMEKSICREFGVDFIWLTTGEGDMFFDLSENEDDKEQIWILNELLKDESSLTRNVFKMFRQKYTAEDWKLLLKLISVSSEYLVELMRETDESNSNKKA